jgi:hypothetical protein
LRIEPRSEAALDLQAIDAGKLLHDILRRFFEKHRGDYLPARDRKGLRDDAASRSWNSSHPSRGPDGGCSQADLRSTGGDGLFYCFAAQ